MPDTGSLHSANPAPTKHSTSVVAGKYSFNFFKNSMYLLTNSQHVFDRIVSDAY